MEDLELVRSKWLKAYLSADIEALKTIESSKFKAISEHGVEHRGKRHGIILQRKESGGWFKSNVTANESDVTYTYIDNACHVVGAGRIEAKGKVLRQSNFSELWINHDGLWKIECLHSSQANKI